MVTRWIYHHARWFYKFLSGYAYDFNCEVEELLDEIDKFMKDSKLPYEIINNATS